MQVLYTLHATLSFTCQFWLERTVGKEEPSSLLSSSFYCTPDSTEPINSPVITNRSAAVVFLLFSLDSLSFPFVSSSLLSLPFIFSPSLYFPFVSSLSLSPPLSSPSFFLSSHDPLTLSLPPLPCPFSCPSSPPSPPSPRPSPFSLLPSDSSFMARQVAIFIG